MQITVEPQDTFAILHLRGEFDTFACPDFQAELDSLTNAGLKHVVVNLRLVRFINSTALGAILKASRGLQDAGGKLVVSHPSSFCREILEKIGLDRVIGVYSSDADAIEGLDAPSAAGEGPGFEEDASTVLFRPSDPSRLEHYLDAPRSENPVHGHAFGSHWSGVARMTALDTEGLAFTWGGGKTGLDSFQMSQFLAVGTELGLKFKLPLLRKGFSEAPATVTEITQADDHVEVRATFGELDAETSQAVQQYVQDMAVLKAELRKATDA